MYLTINALLTHAPGDQLRILRAKIENENEFVMHFLSKDNYTCDARRRPIWAAKSDRIETTPEFSTNKKSGRSRFSVQIDFLNYRSILVFICILQGVLFAGLLVRRWFINRSNADLWLALLLLLLSSSLITPFIGFANVYDLNQWLTYFPFSILYSYGVCVWFYTLYLTDSQRKFSLRDLSVFIPSAIYLGYRFFLFSHTDEWKGWYNNTYNHTAQTFIFVTELVWNLFFLYLAIAHYRKYRSWLNENYSDTEKIKFDWLRNFLYVFAAVLILGAIFDFTDSFLFKLSYIQYFYFEIVLSLVTYYLAIAGYLRSQTIELHFAETQGSKAEQKGALLAETELQKLKDRLQSVMDADRPYLEPTITLTDLARNIGVNTSVLSYVINKGFGKNFNDFVNGYRIDKVKAKLGSADESTLTAIAFESGFNSKATFNRAFKKFTGTTPKDYQASLQEH